MARAPFMGFQYSSRAASQHQSRRRRPPCPSAPQSDPPPPRTVPCISPDSGTYSRDWRCFASARKFA